MRESDDRHWYEIYEGDEKLIAEIPRCGLVEFARGTRQAFGAARGSDARSFELYFVIGGLLGMQVDGEQVETAAGEILVVKPGQTVVGGGPEFAVDPCHVCWMVLRPRVMSEKRPGALDELTADLAQIGKPVFAVSHDTVQACNRLVAEHRLRDRRSVAMARALTIIAVTGVIRDYERLINAEGEEHNWAAARILSLLERIERDNTYNLTIDEMATQCRLSHSYFCRVFAHTLGATPAEHLIRLRIRKARTLLAETDQPVTDIAMTLGFSSSQYFATVFRKYSDFTPSAYRRQMRP